MPLLNPASVLSSPYLSDDVWITQREETVGDDGEASTTPTSRESYGIVTVASPNDMERLPEGQYAGRVMCFLMPEQVRGPSINAQADLLTWGDPASDYVVIKCEPYPNYGEGWYQVIASSQDIIDAAL